MEGVFHNESLRLICKMVTNISAFHYAHGIVHSIHWLNAAWWHGIPLHDDAMTCNRFPHYWPFVDLWPISFKGSAIKFSSLLTWASCWANNWIAGDLRCLITYVRMTSSQWYQYRMIAHANIARALNGINQTPTAYTPIKRAVIHAGFSTSDLWG